jgi:predicted DNA-binding transcriptional regulator YafY
VTKADRWLDLVTFLLQYRVPVTREQILQSVDAYRTGLQTAEDPDGVRRTFDQDVEQLGRLGVEIEVLTPAEQSEAELTTTYRLRPGDFYLPYLELEPAPTTSERPAQPYRGLRTLKISRKDLGVLERATRRLAGRPDFPLAAAAVAARRKLAFDLPLTTQQVERILAGLTKRRAAQALEVLQQAVATRRCVRVTYYSIGRDLQEQLDLEPYGLFFNWGRWYCVAGAPDQSGWRVFRVDRMRDPGPLQATFARPAKFSVADYVGRLPWELSETPPVRVRARFAFPESRWVLAQHVGLVREPFTPDGGAVLDFQVNDPGPFLRWLLTFRDHVRVEEPAAVAGALERLRRQVAALYADESGA